MFLTGEFSKIARVSKRLLQYYDEIGLLKPARTDAQTGYRYYSARQLPRLNRILALKDLGLSLDQIARMMDEDVTDNEIFDMLLVQKAELEKQLLEDLQRFRQIESRLQRQRGGIATLPDVVIKSIPAQEILSVEHLCINPDDGLRFIGYLMERLPDKVSMRHLGHFIALADLAEFIIENIDLEFGFFVEGQVPPIVALDDDITMKTRTLPAVETMATTIYVGHARTSHIGYRALGEWIEAHGYQIAGNQREIFIELPNPGPEDDVVLEIQFPVKKVEASSVLLSE